VDKMDSIYKVWKNKNPQAGETEWKKVTFKEGEKILSPFVAKVSGAVVTEAQSMHNKRSKASRTADESFNAPITLDEEEWARNKNKLDFPGVDTINEVYYARRAERFHKKIKKKGYVTTIETSKSKFNPGGKIRFGYYAPHGIERRKYIPMLDYLKERGYKLDEQQKRYYAKKKHLVKSQSGKPEIMIYPKIIEGFGKWTNTPVSISFTKAHELGHAFDLSRKYHKNQISIASLLSTKDPEFKHNMQDISKKMRGGYSRASAGHAMYRVRKEELIADTIASMVLQPRATKRMNKKLYKQLKEVMDIDLGGK
jgi:hypothetical protein